MQSLKIEPYKVIGIAVRTTNENGKSAQDIGMLWDRFMQEGVLEKIPNKVDTTLYSIYTDYEGDYLKPYTTLLGCRVASLDQIPEGMTGKAFEGGEYREFVAKGNLSEGVVYQEWLRIWNMDLERAYTADFEVYDEKAQNPTDAEVGIFIALQK